MGETNLNIETQLMRRITLNEKLYFINESLSPPMAIQMIVEGNGMLTDEDVKDAVDRLRRVIPAIEYTASGKYWEHEMASELLTIHDRELPINMQDAIFTDSIGQETEQLFEMHLFQGKKSSSLVFRAHHALMDGAGMILCMRTFFQLLRGEQVQVILQFPTELEIQRKIGAFNNTSVKQSFRSEWKGLYPAPNTDISTSESTVLQVNKGLNFITGKIARWHTEQIGAASKFLIPVDIRRHLDDFKSVANLSCPVYLEARPEESAEEIQGKLIEKLMNKEELSKNPMETFGKITPAKILRSILLERVKSSLKRNNYPLSGFISDLGYVELKEFSAGNFKATDFQSIPVFISLAPFCAIVCQHSGGTRIGLSVPAYYDLSEISESLLAFLNTEQINSEIKPATETKYAEEISLVWADIFGKDADDIEMDITFESLGGSSMNLILMLTNLEKMVADEHRGDFLTESLLHGGKITPALLSTIIERFK